MDEREEDAAKTPRPTEKAAPNDREARLAAALRANLRRRKASGRKSKA